MARNLVEANYMDIPEVLLLDAVDKDSIPALGFIGPANVGIWQLPDREDEESPPGLLEIVPTLC